MVASCLAEVTRALSRPDPRPPQDAAASILVNYFEWGAVGHMIEALAVVNGIHVAEPTTRISLAVNSATPTELAGLVPAVATLYPVRYSMQSRSTRQAAAALAPIPGRAFDWIVNNFFSANRDRMLMAPGFLRYYRQSLKHFTPRRGWGLSTHSPPPYQPNQTLRLAIPENLRVVAREALKDDAVRVGVLLAGAQNASTYPSLQSWERMLAALDDEFGGAQFCFVGRHGHDVGRTSSSFSEDSLERLLQRFPRSVSTFSMPLKSQLAMVEACDVMIGPHSGFLMAALAVETPCLYLSGNLYPEYFFNHGVPTYSVLPGARFPCYPEDYQTLEVLADDSDGEGPRSVSMCASRFVEDLPEIVFAARGLVEKRWTFDDLMYHHFQRLVEVYEGDTGRVTSWDAVHARYIDDLFLRKKSFTLA